MRDKEEIVRVALYAHRNGGTGVLSTGGSSIARISGAPRTWGGSLGVRF